METTHRPHCPQCRSSILEEKVLSDGETHIDVCPRCRGGWFDADELARVLSCAVDELHVSSNVEKTSCICPKCGVPLARIEYPDTQIKVDVCDECSGVWLDRGEFRGINEARARYQDQLKFEEPGPPPANLREAAVQFVDRILVRYLKLG
jgi:Zn-finger nucleic acid-binding protein